MRNPLCDEFEAWYLDHNGPLPSDAFETGADGYEDSEIAGSWVTWQRMQLTGTRLTASRAALLAALEQMTAMWKGYSGFQAERLDAPPYVSALAAIKAAKELG